MAKTKTVASSDTGPVATGSANDMPMRWLVCGSRTFSNFEMLAATLDRLLADCGGNPVIVQGAATGADTLADKWATARGLDVDEFPADWKRLGIRAGFLRNQEMLNSGIDYVVAFIDKPLADSMGTADMVRRAQASGVHGVVVRNRTITPVSQALAVAG